MDKMKDSVSTQPNSKERKIYPLTAEIIDRAEANTVKNFERYLKEEKRKA